MPLARRSRHDSHQLAAQIASALIGALLLSAAAPTLHDCHDHGHAPCPICTLAKAPICAPELPAPPPALETRLRLIVLPVARPTYEPLFTFAARAPPAELL